MNPQAQHNAKQTIAALDYISMSISTVRNDIEALYGQEHKRGVDEMISTTSDINNDLKSINNDFNSLVDKSKSMANVSMDCRRLHQYLSSIHDQIIDALNTSNHLNRVGLDFIAENIQENTKTPSEISLDKLLDRQDREHSFDVIPLESDLLLKRVKDGGHSGQFLADAFISSYRTNTPFNHSLGEIMRLDNEAIRLFHQTLHLRFIKGWSDALYYDIEQEILRIGGDL